MIDFPFPHNKISGRLLALNKLCLTSAQIKKHTGSDSLPTVTASSKLAVLNKSFQSWQWYNHEAPLCMEYKALVILIKLISWRYLLLKQKENWKQ